MKTKFILFLLLTVGFCVSGMQAQEKRATIIDDLETLVPGEGIIQITCDPKITELIGTPSPETGAGGLYQVETNGYRIQVFMSNNSRTGREEVKAKGLLMKGAFPETNAYSKYDTPNWKLLVGDFLTKEEAEVFMQKLQKEIPALGKEMYIISDRIIISIQ